jgi:hypothetical protein
MEKADLKKYSEIVSQGFEHAKPAIEAQYQYEISKKGNKEKKRATFANLLNKAMHRQRNVFKFSQENAAENQEARANALHHAARGFAETIKKMGGK